MGDPSLDLTRIALLADPVRRSLFDAVPTGGGWLTRDAAGHSAGVSRSLAAFHLDKLAAAGLLDVEYRRPQGRDGPGAGRPLKRYRRARVDLAWSLSQRRDAVVAEILLRAVAGAGEVRAVAFEYGRSLGVDRGGDLIGQLSALGYEPRLIDGALRLENCPFRALTAEHRETVCGLNLALVEGVIAGIGVSARAQPELCDACCVRVAMA